MRGWFQRVVLSRRWATFLVLGLSFLAFGSGTLNLFYLLHANLELLATHGWLAVMEGGLHQLAELIAVGLLSLVAWLVFKACEQTLVQWLTHKEAPNNEDRHPPR